MSEWQRRHFINLFSKARCDTYCVKEIFRRIIIIKIATLCVLYLQIIIHIYDLIKPPNNVSDGWKVWFTENIYL